MTPAIHLLVILAEEFAEISELCSRVAIRVSKAIRFGLDEVQPGQMYDNAQRIADELADLKGVIELLEERGIIPRSAVAAKKEKVAAFTEFARKLGTVEGGGPC